jgi:nicotinic acid mononucleotide adenylyltransferase
MELPEITAAINQLDSGPALRVARFDIGAALSGRVAVLPSAFNPPTVAHLHLLETALVVDGITSAAAMLTTRNVAKEVFGASLPERVGMLLALARSHSALAVLAVSAARLADQGEALRSTFPGVEFDFVVGYDTLIRVFDERYYSEMAVELRVFFGRHRLIATNRGAAGVEEVARYLEQPEIRPYAHRVVVRELDDHPASLSSSAAREQILRLNGSDALPQEVERYIQEHGLYRPG